MNALIRSWCIFRKSLILMGEKPKLLAFPVISLIAVLSLLALIAIGFIMPPGMEFVHSRTMMGGASKEENMVFACALYFAIYLLIMIVSTSCSVAFYSEIFHALSGESVSLTRGVCFAGKRFSAICLWSLMAATVGLILAHLDRKANLFGRIVIKLIGMSAAVCSCFAIPVIVCEENAVNPLHVLRKSASLLRNTWGEALIGFSGIHILTAVAFIPVILLAVGGTFFLPLPPFYLFVGLGILVLAFFIFLYLVGVAQQIFTAALYLYAKNGESVIFDQEELLLSVRMKS